MRLHGIVGQELLAFLVFMFRPHLENFHEKRLGHATLAQTSVFLRRINIHVTTVDELKTSLKTQA